MEKAVKFLGICILIAAIIVCASIVYSQRSNRYVSVNSVRVLDKQNGII
jgi:archaellum component FlaF (FlaF/FlaG flagellin family)